MDHPDHPIGGLWLPSKVFMALIDHTGEGYYGDQTVAALCGLIQHWAATTPAARCLWREDADQDSDDGAVDSTCGATPITPPPGPMLTASSPAAPAPGAGSDAVTSRGYQWKQLFLPNGTELRTIYAGRSTYAVVEDEQIISDKGPTTPSRLANRCGCGSRNAWQTVWLRLPGGTRWQRAAECRRLSGA